MERRLDYRAVAPEGIKCLTSLYGYLAKSGLDPSLLHLVFLRVSQINGCAYCVDLHSRDALRDGDSVRRVNNLVTWREAPFFTARERAALAWAEALTRIVETGAPDDAFAAVRAQFSDKELADLTYAIGMMNALNRVSIGFRNAPAAEEPGAAKAGPRAVS
jgi:AhpD family alkylhydroperoxidase